MICLFFKIPENFVRFILRDRFRVVHLPFVRKVKFHFLVQFLGDNLPSLVESSPTLFWCTCAVFAYYVVDRFFSIIT